MRHAPIERALFRRARFERFEDRLVFSAMPGWDSYLPETVEFTDPALDWSATTPETEGFASLSNADYIHNVYGLYGSGQTVAIIDSGIAYDHLALGAGFGEGYRVVGGADFTEENDSDPYDDGPAGFHGTHVAGIVASQDENHTGIAPNVDLVALRVFNDQGSGYIEWVEQALQWVHEHRNDFRFPITTVNLSVGSAWNDSTPPDGAILEDELAILEQDGIFIAVAAGNSFSEFGSPGLSYPAASPHVVAISSVGNDGQLSEFSQRLTRALAAPGEGITSTVPDALLGADGYPNDWMATSGTSMAAPYVAGASVLVREAFQFLGHNSIDQSVIYAQLRDTADELVDSVTGQVYYSVNLARALDDLLPADDYGSDRATAHNLGVVVDSASVSGLLTTLDDRDVFQFTAGFTGEVSLKYSANHAVNFHIDGIGLVNRDVAGQWSFDVEAGETYFFSLATGQRLATFDLDLALTPTSPIRIDGNLILVQGTSGDDAIEIWASQQFELIINGNSYSLPPGSGWQIQVVGHQGNDTLTIHGSANRDELILRPGQAEMTGSGYELTADGFERIVVFSGGGGDDEVHFYGTPENDVFTARIAESSLTGDGYENRAVDFDRVYASASGGNDDVAHFFDSSGDDLFIGRSGYSLFRSTDRYNKAYEFDRHYVHATSGVDIAKFYDSAGDDLFIARPDQDILNVDSYDNKTDGLDQNRVPVPDGKDVAKFFDSAGDDLSAARPDRSILNGDGDFNKAHWFEQDHAHVSLGHDVANFYSSAGNVALAGQSDFSYLTSPSPYSSARSYNTVHDFDAVRTGSNDITPVTRDSGFGYVSSELDWTVLEDLTDANTIQRFERVILEMAPKHLDSFYLAAVDYFFFN